MQHLYPFAKTLLGLACLVLFLGTGAAFAQTTSFNYQGRLPDSLPDGIYEMQFKLFDAAADGNQVGSTLTLDGFGSNPPAVTVTGGAFTVQLDFGADVFPGADRYLEVWVKYSGETTFTPRRPRQQLTSRPYAIRSLSAAVADTANNATNLDGVAASKYVQTVDSRLSDARPPTAGSSDYIQNRTSPQSSSNFSISGDGTAGGTLSGNTVNAETQYNLGGNRVLKAAGNNLFAGIGAGQINTAGSANSFVGANAGINNTAGSANSFFGASAGAGNATGGDNSFFGRSAGLSNTTGGGNSFFGRSAGLNNTTGGANAFFGLVAGQSNTAGDENSFFGVGAGAGNTTGGSNSFFGRSAGLNNLTGFSNLFFGAQAGLGNTSGSDNTFVGRSAGAGNGAGASNTIIGSNANVGSDGLDHATAVGAGSVVSSSNTVVLGRGADIVQVPGNLNVIGTLTGSLPSGSANYVQNTTTQQASSNFNISGNGTADGTLSGNTVNAATQYNIGGLRVLGAAGYNLFAGFGAGSNTTGNYNSFFGREAGNSNTAGAYNSFFGMWAGQTNTTGDFNAFFGKDAGNSNTTGDFNSFFGVGAGRAGNSTGTNNTLIGSFANVGSNNLDHATAVGAGSVVRLNNTVVLGRDIDTVRVPGSLVVNAINSETQYNLGGLRVLGAAGYNLFAGFGAGSNTTGNYNSFFGREAGNSNTAGAYNSFFGMWAGQTNTTGDFNAFFGKDAGNSNTTGDFNSFFGVGAGRAGNSTGTNNTLIGSFANVGSNNLDHATAVGAGSVVRLNNTVVLGRDIDTVQVPGSLTVATLGTAGRTKLCLNASNQIADCSSSLRYKTNIAPFSSGLKLISRLRPISFDWKTDGQRDVGFGAEEVAAINPLFVIYNSKGQVEGVKYDRLSVAFVNAFKEQQSQIEQQRDQIRKQQNQIDALRKLVCLDHPNADVCK